jgi:hypothetical protein
VTDREFQLWRLDPATAESVWQSGWQAAHDHARHVELPLAWNRGFLMGILVSVLALLVPLLL